MYRQYAVPHIPKPEDEALAESNSDDDGIMNSYSDKVDVLTDTSTIRLTCGNVNMQKMSTDQHGKPRTAMVL